MAGSHVDAAQSFAHTHSVTDNRGRGVSVTQKSGEAIGFQNLGDSQGKITAQEPGIMPDNDVGFKLGQSRGFLATFGFEVIGNGLSGEPDPVEGKILGDQAAPTGGPKLNGRQFVHGNLIFPIKGLLFEGIYVTDKKNAQK